MKQNSGYTKRGFTVVESLVSISILLLSITAAFAVAQSSLQSSNLVKNRTTAYFLAQEGIEYIRHMRDNNGLRMLDNRFSDIHWLDGFAEDANAPCAFGKACIVDITAQMPPSECPSGVCPNLYEHVITGLFHYNPSQSTLSNFKRTIRITQADGSGNEIKVTAIVDWMQGSIPRSLEVTENLYNWQQLQPL